MNDEYSCYQDEFVDDNYRRILSIWLEKIYQKICAGEYGPTRHCISQRVVSDCEQGVDDKLNHNYVLNLHEIMWGSLACYALHKRINNRYILDTHSNQRAPHHSPWIFLECHCPNTEEH